MKDNKLHIVTFDIPYPANYGGAIDVFYRLKALSESGVSIYLHCFYKGELYHATELESLCEQIYYYPRHTSFQTMLHIRPYAVCSRTSPDLLTNILHTQAPILFEGLVSCGLLDHPALQHRKKYLRECNVEHDYFYGLARAADNMHDKLYYMLDSIRLHRFERIVNNATAIFAIAHQDEEHFRTNYPKVPTYYIPASHSNDAVTVPLGLGQYILYHGNLDVAENYNAALTIIRHISPLLPHIPFIIAGRYHNHAIDDALATATNVHLEANPTNEQMEQLIHNAQIHLHITHQATGLKLKLLNALYHGRHIVVNPEMITGTDVAPLCHVGHNYRELAELCAKLFTTPVSRQQIMLRQTVLSTYYNNHTLAQQLIQYIFSNGNEQ